MPRSTVAEKTAQKVERRQKLQQHGSLRFKCRLQSNECRVEITLSLDNAQKSKKVLRRTGIQAWEREVAILFLAFCAALGFYAKFVLVSVLKISLASCMHCKINEISITLGCTLRTGLIRLLENKRRSPMSNNAAAFQASQWPWIKPGDNC